MKNAVIYPMTEQHARRIADWDFGPGFEFYNIEGDEDVIEAFMNGHYYCVLILGELVGFFCDGEMARLDFDYDRFDGLDIGFALRPDLTSRGLGRSFLELIMDFYHVQYYRVTVASFNSRAVKLYQHMGFQRTDQFTVEYLLERYEFYVMVKIFQPQD